MAVLFGKQYEKKALLEKVGDISQICGVKRLLLSGGRSAGVELARLWTGSGLEFDVNLSRGMGLGAFRYKGVPLGWISAVGDAHPGYYEPEGGGLDRNYTGGLLHNSGLRQVGAPNEDEGEALGLHGRISNLPADNVAADGYWEGEEYILAVSGKVREVSALGENLLLSRRVTAKMGSKSVLLEDVVSNEGPTASPHMILYHTNFGFPLLDEGTRLVISSEKVTDAATGEPVPEVAYGRCDGVSPSPEQPIYFHQTSEKDGWSGYVIVNDALGIGLRVTYLKKNLPELIHWTNLQTGRNVMEVGPSNCKCFGRAAERKAGTLQYLEAGEAREYKICFTVLEGGEEIEKAVSQIKG